jgi:hypothetical protein
MAPLFLPGIRRVKPEQIGHQRIVFVCSAQPKTCAYKILALTTHEPSKHGRFSPPNHRIHLPRAEAG